MAMTSEFVQTTVGKVQVHRGGAGSTVVYLHSATGEGIGVPFTDAMTERHDVVAPMFPGFGESEGIEQIDDMEDAVFHLLDLWDVLGLDAPVVVGLSLGAWMGAELATRYPERVGRLVLVNPAGLYIEGAPILDIFGRSPADMAHDLFFDQSHPMAQLLHQFADYRSDPAQIGNLTFEMIKPIVQTMSATARLGWDPYLHNPKLPKRLHRVTAPTLVVRGEHDTLIPEPHARYYAEHIAGARLEVVPDVAHLLPIERGDELARIVEAFIG